MKKGNKQCRKEVKTGKTNTGIENIEYENDNSKTPQYKRNRKGREDSRKLE